MNTTNRNYCRLCAGFIPISKLVDLHDDAKTCRDIARKLSRFNIKVNFNDCVLPNIVCIACISSLECSFNFVAAVEEGQKALNKLISVHQNIENESDLETDTEHESCTYEYEVTEGREAESTDESIDVNPSISVSLQQESTEQSNITISNENDLNQILNEVDMKFESNSLDSSPKCVPSKDLDFDEHNKSDSDNENFFYELVIDNNCADSKVKSKKVNSVPKSQSKQSNKGRNIMYRRNDLPESELQLSWKDYNWLCSYCETQFPSYDELTQHSMEYHKVCNPFQCIDCKARKLHLNKFLVHVKIHRQYLKFSCYKCSRKFNTTWEAARHAEYHLESDFICFGCNESFTCQEEWFKHTKTFYKNKRTTSIFSLQDDTLTCVLCKKNCDNINQLNCHLLTHTNNICEICGKCFFYKSLLIDHQISHSDARPFQCEICNSAFKTKRMLKVHKYTHEDKRPFICDTCGKGFRSKYRLSIHVVTHTDKLPYVCTFCGKRARSQPLLDQHLRQHTGERPFSCATCKRTFTNWANCNKHMKRKHNTTLAKKKRTPIGMFPIDPVTGDIVYPPGSKITQSKPKPMEPRNATTRKKRKQKAISKDVLHEK